MAELNPLIVSATPVSVLDERTLYDSPLGEGVDGYEDLRVATGGSGLLLDVGAGVGYVRGDSVPDQGLYRCRNDATVSSANFTLGALAPADGANPRIDQVIAHVYDHEADASGQRTWQLEVLTGTPTAGADLDDRLGAAALPDSAMRLADILVPAGFTGPFVDATHVRDRRPFVKVCVPPLLTDGDRVQLIPALPTAVGALSGTPDTHQAAALHYLPRRIVNATRIRWRYEHGVTALAGNYVLAIYDASGRLIVDTGAVAFTGAGLTSQERSEAIAATTFEAGVYYVFLGLDTTNAGSAEVPVVSKGADPPPTTCSSAQRAAGSPSRRRSSADRPLAGDTRGPAGRSLRRVADGPHLRALCDGAEVCPGFVRALRALASARRQAWGRQPGDRFAPPGGPTTGGLVHVCIRASCWNEGRSDDLRPTANRPPDDHFEALIENFSIAGMGATPKLAEENAFELLDDYLHLCLEEGLSWDQVLRRPAIRQRLKLHGLLLAGRLGDRLRNVRRESVTGRFDESGLHALNHC